jgi:hypothetical protein
MSYTYLLAQGEASSAECFSDIPASVLLKLNLTPEKCCSNGNGMASCQGFQSGIMSPPSTAHRGEEKSMLSAEASLAKTLAQPERGLESRENEADFGESRPESFVRYSHDTHSWKIRQYSLLEGLDEFSETWPKWGMMQGGQCFQVLTPVIATLENESGFLPTICASEMRDISRAEVLAKLDKGGRVARRFCSRVIPDAKEIVGLNPCFAEWMQGWPDSWTELKPLETDKMQAWLRSHGASSQAMTTQVTQRRLCGDDH